MKRNEIQAAAERCVWEAERAGTEEELKQTLRDFLDEVGIDHYDEDEGDGVIELDDWDNED